MSDNPARAITVMRRQLEMRLEYDDERIHDILTVDANAAISDLGLPDEDVQILRQIGFSARDDLFGVSEADAAALYEMSNEIRLLGEAEYSDQRHEFLLRRTFILAKEVGGLADALEDRDAAETIVRHINAEKAGSSETNKDYRVSLRVFGDLLTDGEEPPDSLEWVPGGYPKTHDPAPLPEKMYRWKDHIIPMLDACLNSRDRALVALAWDLGPRPGELFDLTLGRFTDHEYGLKVTLYQGKQGTRSPVLVPSVPYVKQWREDHPASGASDVPLWSKLNTPERITNNRVRDILKEIADRADMEPPSTPTPRRMRKSSASHLASQPGVSQPHLEDHHGWSRGSKVAGRYIAVFGDANDRAIAAAHGVDVTADEPDATGPVPCYRCEQPTPRHEERCIHCGQAMSYAAAQEGEELQQSGLIAVGKLIQEQGLDVDDAAHLVDGLVSQRVDAKIKELGLSDHDSVSSSE